MKKFILIFAFSIIGLSAANAQSYYRERYRESITGESRLDECARLYVIRNKFYRDRGLCFTRPGAVEIFGRRGCTIRNSEDFPISASEKRAIDAIVDRERELRCPRP